MSIPDGDLDLEIVLLLNGVFEIAIAGSVRVQRHIEIFAGARLGCNVIVVVVVMVE